MTAVRGQRAPHGGPAGPAARVLLIGDEPATAHVLAAALHYEGWEVDRSDTAAALRAAMAFRPDVVVLDLAAAAVLQELRAQGQDVAALFLATRDAVEDGTVASIARDADHLITPYRLDALVARLRRLLRRRAEPAWGTVALVVGDLVLDEDGQEVLRGNEVIELTATERELLGCLMRSPGTVLSRAQILAQVWQHDFGGQVDVVDLYVACLRNKIGADRPPMIEKVGAEGYVLVPEAAT